MAAEDFLQESLEISHFYNEEHNVMMCFSKDIQKAMIEFARYQVEKFRKEILETLKYDSKGELPEHKDELIEILLRQHIEKTFPIENIK